MYVPNMILSQDKQVCFLMPTQNFPQLVDDVHKVHTLISYVQRHIHKIYENIHTYMQAFSAQTLAWYFTHVFSHIQKLKNLLSFVTRVKVKYSQNKRLNTK